jgi:hypothetical protein
LLSDCHMVLRDITQAWDDYVGNTITVTVTSAGVPWGQTEFNPGEKVKYALEVTNGTASSGVQVKDIRLHLTAGRVGDALQGFSTLSCPLQARQPPIRTQHQLPP